MRSPSGLTRTSTPAAGRSGWGVRSAASADAPSSSSRPAGIRFIVPTNSATKAVAGWSYSSSGGAICSSRPSRITPTRSAIDRASSWSCVTNSVVVPRRCWSGPDLLAQLQSHLGVERGQRLVEQQHPGLDRQRAGQRDPLLLPAGQLVRVLPALGGQADHVEQVGGPPLPLGGAEAAHPQAEARRSPAPSCSGTGCSSGTPCPCPAGPRAARHVPAVHLDRAGIGGSKPARIRSAVVLPQPDGPSRATSSPGASRRLSPSRARVAPKDRDRFRSSTVAPEVFRDHAAGVASPRAAFVVMSGIPRVCASG